ncbi:MAG TPA: CGNR zinc finger domain-containing protein [Pyrinomonadaceae bacterium]|nr:CGNR zinc finger domain-containing protein [Pyrinomonadaceae bacterium]
MTKRYAFIGNNLSLDFVNTVGYISSENPIENLNSFSDLIEWSKQGKLISDDEAIVIFTKAKENILESERVFRRVLRLRKSVYDIFRSVISGEEISDEDLTILNRELSLAMSKAEIFSREGELIWDWKNDGIERILFLITRIAAQLLTSSDLEKLKCCSGENCGWLFYDTSKNKRRQWCDMRDCGNLAKARRFRVKKAR